MKNRHKKQKGYILMQKTIRRTYTEDTPFKEIKADLCVTDKIYFYHDKMFNSYNDAEKFLTKYINPNINIAIPYYDYNNIKPTPEMKENRQKAEKIKKKLDKLCLPKNSDNKITCPNCNSNISAGYFDFRFNHKCPVCNKPFITKDQKQSYKHYKKKLKRFNKEYDQMVQDLIKQKRIIRGFSWLVQVVAD